MVVTAGKRMSLEDTEIGGIGRIYRRLPPRGQVTGEEKVLYRMLEPHAAVTRPTCVGRRNIYIYIPSGVNKRLRVDQVLQCPNVVMH